MSKIRRTAMTVAALLAVVPAVACAKGDGQSNAQARTQAQPGGMTLAQFEARRGGRMMAADSDGDGRISRAEFISARQGRTAQHGGDPASRFDRLDANRDGFVDKGEMDAMLARRFQRMDANGDGVVTRDERAAMHQRAGSAGGNPANGGAGYAPGDAEAGNE